jgi:hypothetical protein
MFEQTKAAANAAKLQDESSKGSTTKSLASLQHPIATETPKAK